MALASLLSVFGVGLLAGLLSGLVGIGGGVLIVPFLYFFYAHPGWAGVGLPPEVATVAAHATSLAVIVPTSMRGAWAFHRQGMVAWPAVWPIGIASAVAAALAAQLAVLADPRLLRLAFGVLLILSAWRLFRSPKRPELGDTPRELRLSLPATLGTGTVVGSFSALLGVGGGIVSIPLLIGVVGVEVKRVAATSLAIIALTSTAGMVAYMVGGAEGTVRPGLSLGYVDLAVAGAMVAGTLLSVRWGAAINRRMDARSLSVVFAALFGLLGARLMFENLPF